MMRQGAISNRKTLLLAFASLSLLIILGMIYSFLIFGTVEEQALAENREANLVQAEAAARYIAQEQEGLLSLLSVIASRASLREALAKSDSAALEAFFQPVLDLSPQVNSVFALKKKGGFLVRVPSETAKGCLATDLDLVDGPWFSDLIGSHDGRVERCLVLTVPVRSPDGQVLAHLGVSQPPSHWKNLFGQLSARPGRSFFLFDRTGALITGNLSKAELPAAALNKMALAVRDALPRARNHWSVMHSPDDISEPVFAAAARVALSDWVVVALHEYQVAMAPTRAMLRNIFMLLALLFLCLLFMGFILLSRFQAQRRHLVRLDGEARQLEALVSERTADLEMSTQRYLSLVQDLPDMVYELDHSGRFTFVSQAAETILGYKPETMLGRAYRDFVMPEDRLKFDEEKAGSSGTQPMNIVALRHRRADDGECWLSIHSRGLFDARGHFLGRRGVARDVTRQILAEQRIHQLSGQLINAQEEERKQLAMDLHDEMGQLLSALKIGLQTMARTNTADRPGLDKLIGLTQEIMDRSRSLAYRLRPAILDSFGLSASLTDLCESLNEDGVLKIEHNLEKIDEHVLGPAVKTTLFRFVQEALTNAIKHSGSARVEVRLYSEGGKIKAEVLDFGRGFEAEKVLSQMAPRRLGLLGMHERIKLQNGRLTIKSGPKGTLLKAELSPGGLP